MKLYELVEKNEDFEKIKRIAGITKDINEVDENGWSALMFAINNNETKIVDILIDEGADVNIEDKDGNTPLKLARENGNRKIITLLFKAGAILPSQRRA